MYILGVESSAVSASAALMKDGKLIGEAYINAGLTHSQTLMTLIDNVLKNAGITFKDIDIAAVAHGPGSFTGIRIGVAAVKGLCFVNDTPCYGISTLEGLANCADVDSFIICPVMDARCMQVYTALFEKQDGETVRLLEDTPMKLEELAVVLKEYDKKILLLGDGADIAYKFLSEKNENICVFSEVFKYQHACGIATAAQKKYNKGISPVKSDELLPVYLRLSQAERELKSREMLKNDSNKQ